MYTIHQGLYFSLVRELANLVLKIPEVIVVIYGWDVYVETEYQEMLF